MHVRSNIYTLPTYLHNVCKRHFNNVSSCDLLCTYLRILSAVLFFRFGLHSHSCFKQKIRCSFDNTKTDWCGLWRKIGADIYRVKPAWSIDGNQQRTRCQKRQEINLEHRVVNGRRLRRAEKTHGRRSGLNAPVQSATLRERERERKKNCCASSARQATSSTLLPQRGPRARCRMQLRERRCST